MASQNKVPSENDVIPPAEETLDFDNDNLRGEQNRYYFFLEGPISLVLEHLKTQCWFMTLLYIFFKTDCALIWKVTINSITNEKNPDLRILQQLF